MAPGIPRPRAASPRPTADAFTLIELIVTMAILVVVLSMAYKILDNCLRSEKIIERQNLPEKIGQGIILLIRKDIEGIIYRNLGTDGVFEVIDGGAGDGARDELHGFTTREPTPAEDFESAAEAEGGIERTITAFSYFLKENQKGCFTLFRREAVGMEADPFTGGQGTNHEVYDRVKSLDIQCFDGLQYYDTGMPWLESWDSRQRIAMAAQYDEEQAEEEGGISRITQGTGGAGTEAAAGMEAVNLEAALPPAAIPSAVRIEVSVYVADERGVYKDKDGNYMAPKVFSAVIPILAAQRIPLTLEDEASAEGGAEGGAGGAEGGETTVTQGVTAGANTKTSAPGSRGGGGKSAQGTRGGGGTKTAPPAGTRSTPKVQLPPAR